VSRVSNRKDAIPPLVGSEALPAEFVFAFAACRASQQSSLFKVDDGYHLTSNMVTARELVDVGATAWTRARDLLDGLERLLLVFIATFRRRSLVVLTRFVFVECYVTGKTVASFALSADEYVAVVFGEQGSWTSVSRKVANS
jgi:hypothetical protein